MFAPNCQWYLEECRRVAGAQAQFVARQSVDERLLASAFTRVQLPGGGQRRAGGERIALKAGASGTPLVLFDGGCGSEYFGQQAVYVRPDDVADIRRGVLAALERKRSKSLAEHVCTYFSWSAVARTMRAAYGAGRTYLPGKQIGVRFACGSRAMIAHIRPPKQTQTAFAAGPRAADGGGDAACRTAHARRAGGDGGWPLWRAMAAAIGGLVCFGRWPRGLIWHWKAVAAGPLQTAPDRKQ